MANFKRPKEYIFVKEIPKSPTGKILRRKLLAGEYDLDRWIINREEEEIC